MTPATLVTNVRPAPAAPAAEPVAAPALELTDADLEHVVGGLSRPWFGSDLAAASLAVPPLDVPMIHG